MEGGPNGRLRSALSALLLLEIRTCSITAIVLTLTALLHRWPAAVSPSIQNLSAPVRMKLCLSATVCFKYPAEAPQQFHRRETISCSALPMPAARVLDDLYSGHVDVDDVWQQLSTTDATGTTDTAVLQD